MKRELLLLLGCTALFADATVSNVAVTQHAVTKVVEVTYDFVGETAAYVTVAVKTNGAAVARTLTVAGDVSTFRDPKTVEPGMVKKIRWFAAADCADLEGATVTAEVSEWAVDGEPPAQIAKWAMLDLSAGKDAATYPVTFSMTGPDLTNDACRTTNVWFRHIPAGSFQMGRGDGTDGDGWYDWQSTGTHGVTLTRDIYAGIFECTQRQYYEVTGLKPSFYTNPSCWEVRPVENITWARVHEGADGNMRSETWPVVRVPGETSFMGKLRARTELAFNLPTEAQWEYACRAGTVSTWYDGSNPTTNLESNAALNLLARYKTNNGGTDANSDLTSGGTTKVGSYVPNAWGLYDLYGNVSEMTLDRNAGYTYDWQTDPVGGTTSVCRIYRGGGAFDAAGNCRSTFRGTALTQTAQNGRLGFRIFFTLE